MNRAYLKPPATSSADNYPLLQWPVNWIGYDALGSYGSPTIYVQVTFNHNRGDQVLASTENNIGRPICLKRRN